MGVIHGKRSTGTGHGPRLWPVLLLLLLVVLVPTVGLLWLMSEAIENERVAARQVLQEAYGRDLANVRDRLVAFWRQRAEDLKRCSQQTIGSAAFAQCVDEGLADSLVCYDADGRLAYPTPPRPPTSDPSEGDPAWIEARRLEFELNDPTAAAETYATIAQQATDTDLAARALQARARCLVQSGSRDAAIELITTTLSAKDYARAVDAQGRLIVANAELMALELMGDASHPDFQATAERLGQRLSNYEDGVLAAPQRRFLMAELKRLLPQSTEFATLDAEQLAAQFVAAHPWPRNDPGLHPSQLPDVWQLASSDGRMVALFRTAAVRAQSREAIAAAGLPAELDVGLWPPEEDAPQAGRVRSLPAGAYLPGWQVTLAAVKGQPADATSGGQVALYLWTGILVIVAMAIVAVLLAEAFRRQMRLTRLKNDLVATVSHELKTPLASIRLLVDTLLDAEQADPNKTREYLELIAKENARLSRLIDNFLAFSRMERNKHAFEFVETSAGRIVEGAVEAVGDRLAGPDSRFDVQVEPDLPPLVADTDALVTAVLNLLDNARKYTGDDKEITLKAYTADGNLCFAVIDNGIGLSRSACKRVFQRFYQVDRNLSRTAGGCGLGLSIVQFIAAAHGGTVRVSSRPGQGSTFTLTVPCSAVTAPTSEETTV